VGEAARPEKAQLRRAQLDKAVAEWIVRDYHHRRHSETGQASAAHPGVSETSVGCVVR
jgi:hypothetical protein